MRTNSIFKDGQGRVRVMFFFMVLFTLLFLEGFDPVWGPWILHVSGESRRIKTEGFGVAMAGCGSLPQNNYFRDLGF